MSVVESVLAVFGVLTIAYFAILSLLHAAFAFVGLQTVILESRLTSDTELRDLLERDVFKPVSIIVPAFNEEATIVAAVQSFIRLHYPKFEVIVIADGSTDGTMDRLIEAFALVEEPRVWARTLPTMPVIRVMRSLRHPGLVVAEKENGGKPDAVNAGINLARYPLIAPVDSDCLLDAQAILRASRSFVKDDAVIAVGGTVRPLNGATIRGGQPAELRMPPRWVERLQIVEYARAFFLGRAGWTRMGALLIISGAFGLFRRDAVLKVGGFWTGTLGEDMELVMRLHKEYTRAGLPHRIIFSPDPICWTEVPSDIATLRRQRSRWHRGLWTNLWRHKDMLLNPRYGRLGLFAVPYFWLFEGLAPAIEVLGFVSFGLAAALGLLDTGLLWLFLALAILHGMVLSQVAAGVEAMLLHRYSSRSDRLILFAASLVEFLGFHQLIAFERFRSTFHSRKKRGEWGEMRRAGIPAAETPKASSGAPRNVDDVPVAVVREPDARRSSIPIEG
jgi:cellulose synthase/poly-beta-1,6-N-acetylglucosamine synthase-like glycosyltransferase